MSHKNKTNKKVECPIDLGGGYKCCFIGKECEYRAGLKECEHYQKYFVSDAEKAKIEEKGLTIIVNNLERNKLNGRK